MCVNKPGFEDSIFICGLYWFHFDLTLERCRPGWKLPAFSDIEKSCPEYLALVSLTETLEQLNVKTGKEYTLTLIPLKRIGTLNVIVIVINIWFETHELETFLTYYGYQNRGYSAIILYYSMVCTCRIQNVHSTFLFNLLGSNPSYWTIPADNLIFHFYDID